MLDSRGQTQFIKAGNFDACLSKLKRDVNHERYALHIRIRGGTFVPEVTVIEDESNEEEVIGKENN